MGDNMGLSPTMTAEDRLQCLFRVLLSAVGEVNVGGVRVGANIVPVVICSLSRWEIARLLKILRMYSQVPCVLPRWL